MLLKEGSTGKDVVLLQKTLRLVPDGDFGDKTRKAVVSFQTHNHLPADGIVGNSTWSLILIVARKRKLLPPKPASKVVKAVAAIKATVWRRPTAGWAMTQSQRFSVYGHNASEVRKGLVKVTWPRKGISVMVHKRHAEQFRRAFKKVDNYEVSRKLNYRIHSVGTFNWRKIRGGSLMSNHSFGIAIDFNPAQNPIGTKLKTDMPPYFRTAFKSEGFRWGGDYKSRKDAMHFEA